MNRHRRIGSLDRNHAPIAADLVCKLGYFVLDTSSLPDGCPDLLVFGHGTYCFMEIKNPALKPSARKLTRAEKAWHDRAGRFGVRVAVIETLQEAADAMQAARRVARVGAP